MNLFNKLNKFEIKRILIADDLEENLNAAKEYFDRTSIYVDYVLNSKDAINKIKNEFKAKKPYDLIMTDLNMEESFSGIYVMREAYKHGSHSIIVTCLNPHLPDNPNYGQHGATTTVFSIIPNFKYSKKIIPKKKIHPDVWERAFNLGVDLINVVYSKDISFNAFNRFAKFTNSDFPLDDRIMNWLNHLIIEKASNAFEVSKMDEFKEKFYNLK